MSRVHDRNVLDALEALGNQEFTQQVWRVTRKGREPLRGAAATGRWSPAGEFEVLYTSLEREGAEAEVGHRLSVEPIWPSRIEHEVHKIDVSFERVINLTDASILERIGVDIEKYKSYDYGATQAIASAAHFLGVDGLLVPNARHSSVNLVIFLEQIDLGRVTVQETSPVDWIAWRARRLRS